MQDFSDLTFLASYATLSLATFALLQRLMLPQSNTLSKGQNVPPGQRTDIG